MRKRLCIAALLLAAVCLLCGCAAQTTSGKTVYLKGELAYESRETVCVIGGEKIPRDLYDYFYRSHLLDVQSRRETESGYLLTVPRYFDTPEEEAKALTGQSLREYVAIHRLAGQYGIKLTKDERDAITATRTEAESGYPTREAYLAALAESNFTEEMYENYLFHDAVEAKLFDYMSKEFAGVIDSTDATVTANIREYFYAAVQIFIEVNDDCPRETALEKARTLYNEAKDADLTRFGEIAAEEGDDGYGIRYFTVGYSYPFFEEAVAALQPGMTSAIVESPLGYHIIRRVPLEDGYIDAHFETLRTDDIVRAYHAIVDETATALDFEMTAD